jgi:hypothetical protein
MTAICHPERSEGPLAQRRPADPTHVSFELLGNHHLDALAMLIFSMLYFDYTHTPGVWVRGGQRIGVLSR